jgi:membrane fusion protein, heavy metal efflux system
MRSPRILFVVAALAAPTACRHGQPDAESQPFKVDGDVVTFLDEAARVAAVRVEAVARAADGHATLTGRLVWDEDATVRVFSPVAGRVDRILADLGATVAKGAPLATLASPDFGQAQSDAARARADLTAAERTVERSRVLFDRGAAPRKELEQAEADVQRARAEAQRTEERLRLWGGADARPGPVDAAFRVTSSIRGAVVERNLNPGQEVRTDATVPLFVISDPHRLWVLLDVTEKDLADVVAGAAILVRSPAYPERQFPGTLDVVGAGLDPATRTIHARGRLVSPEGLLKAEMYVSVDVLKAQDRRHLMVPARSLLQVGERRFVFVEEAVGRYRRIEVKAGPEREGVVPILSGLPESARVVTEGSLLLESAWSEGRAPGESQPS